MSSMPEHPSLQVRCGPEGPRAILWSHEWVPVVHLMDVWKDVGCWWSGEAEKTFYRLELDSGILLEMYRVTHTSQWRLYRIYD